MKRFMIGVFLAIAFCSGLAPGQEQNPDYYPLKRGTKWTYRVFSGNELKGQVTNQIAKIEKIDDQELARQETLAQGNVFTEHLSSTDKGVFRHRLNGLETTPPFCLLRYPVKQGDSWTSESKVGDQATKLSCRVGEEEVAVPSGKFKAVTVLIESEAGVVKVRTTYWFVANIGFVKQLIEIPGSNPITLELERFEVGK